MLTCVPGQLFINDLFGALSAEKDVAAIADQLMEAKCHSDSSFQIVARYVTTRSLAHLLIPLKEVSVSSNVVHTCGKHLSLVLNVGTQQLLCDFVVQ